MSKDKPYHKYVFDADKRRFVGNFEKMYRNEENEHFDSWHQDTVNELKRDISRAILSRYNFSTVLDIGCGKGTFTHLLKKENNTVTGIDVSSTAIKKAQARYPEIVFKCIDCRELLQLNQSFDLVVAIETLSYLKNWKSLIKDIAGITRYLYVQVLIPENPIGYVKNASVLTETVQRFFKIIHHIVDAKTNTVFLFGEVAQ